MEVVSACPLRVGSIVWKNGEGAFTLTVACKATYVLRQGESPLSSHQEELTEADEHWNDDEARSLHAVSDLVPFKRNADVILVGHAYAPRGQPVRSLRAHLVVGEVDKAIEVCCDRAFSLDGQLREGARFPKMALRWERAAGGPETSNPVGVRADAPPDRQGLVALPNLQPVGMHVTSLADFIEPIGFGPIAASWPTRQSKLHAGLAGWDHRRFQELTPNDLDPAFFNAAPPDQQLGVLRANERIVLENLHPRHARLVTNLVAATPRATVEVAGAPTQDLGMRCDTMWIDSDRGACMLTWRVSIPIEHPRQAGRVTINLARSTREEPARARMSTTAEVPASMRRDLPFGAPPPQPSRPEIAPVDRTIDAPLSGVMPALPFRVGRSPLAGTVLGSQQPPAPPQQPLAPPPWAPQAPRTGGDLDGETATDLPADVAAPPMMSPPSMSAPMAPPMMAPPPIVPAPMAPPIVSPAVAVPSMAMPAAAPMVTAPQWTPAPHVEPAWPVTPAAGQPSKSAPPPPAPIEPASLDAPAPPPMIGPLATPEMFVPEEPTSTSSDAEPEPPVEVAKPAPPPPEDPGLPLAKYPIERCAAIAASIARTRARTAAILEEHELTAADWQALSDHWQDEIRAESGRGKSKLLDAFDDAYVAQLEKERGPIGLEGHARLVVASERGTTDSTLAEMSLPPGALLRVSRVWMRKTCADIELAKAADAAIDAARDA